VDTLVLDKTGTVTIGAPAVVQVMPAPGVSAQRLLAVASACGFGSLHPISRAVVTEARARGVEVSPPEDAEERPGLGVIARIAGERAVLGRRQLLAELGVEPGPGEERDAAEVSVSFGDRLLGRLVLRDQPRADARDALAEMRGLGIDRLVLLTGDREGIAREVGGLLGMDEVIADVLPAQKLEVVRAEQAAGRIVMMVGDGVNDALALGGADVGVAIGAEINEVALGGADVALLGADLGRLPRLIRLADQTRRVIGQNVWLAFGFATALIALAAAGVLDPIAGALAQSVAVIAVVVNSARILRFDGQGPRE
jgi:Cu+-exporting ATPase